MKKWYYFIPAGIIMVLIFMFSAQNASQSSSLSSGLTQQVYQRVVSNFPHFPISLSTFHVVIRKLAHFSIYFSLGFTIYFAMVNHHVASIPWSLLICVLYACSDEFHQLFVEGRAGLLSDVLIDSSGALLGILMMAGLFWGWQRFLGHKHQ